MRSVISAKTGHAVVFTRTHAIIWPYASNSTSPDPSRKYLITLPHAAKNASDPLPLGSLVPGPASSEPGLLVLGPGTGRITFWEDISTAATEDLMKQKQHGFQGSVGSMLYGETVTNMNNAEPAGFVLTFSTGRIAHLNVRDLQGKPTISVRFLRGNGSNQTGSLLGGLKNVFGGGAWKRDIVAVSAGTSRSRGQRDVIVATSKAVLQLWDLNWSGNDSLQHEVDAEEDLLGALKEGGATGVGQKEHSLMVLDVTIVATDERSREIAVVGDNQGPSLLALTALSVGGSTRYALVEMTLVKNSVIVDVVHPITCYSTPTTSSSIWTPKVYLPDRSQTALVVFPTTVVLMSLVRIEESPESQLLMDSHKLPQPFQDVIYFRQNDGFEVVGCCAEDQATTQKVPGCALMIRSFGVVRVAALPTLDGADSFNQAQVTAKTKIEQAVFYGSMPQNLIDFTKKSGITFAQEEVEAAALEISDEILRSSSSFIPAITPSLEYQLRLRATALRDLIRHTNANYPAFSRLAKWQLLWNAEKLAAARVVWKNYDASLKKKGKDQNSLLYELVEMLHERFKTENQPDQGESDPVRHWFIKDIWRIEYVVSWAFNAVQELYQEGSKDHPTLMRLVSEANDISLGALETAFRFREENAKLYGLGNEPLAGGVLRHGFEGLPEFWTSTKPTLYTTRQLVDFARELTFKYYDKPPAEGEPDPCLVKKVAAENARQVDVCCQIYIERIRWCKAQDDEKNKADGAYLREVHSGIRTVQIRKLAEIGLLEEGIALAEKYGDMIALVDLIVEALGDTITRSQQPGLSDEDEAALERRMEAIQERMSSYFHTYGDRWARALYSKKISKGLLADLLDDGPEEQVFLTHFLRSQPAYAKISWINEVVNERNYGEAARTLRNHALTSEMVLWNKKIELSLAKLAGMAVSEASGSTQQPDESHHIHRIDNELSLIAVQDRLYAHVLPTIQAAIDETAEVDLVMAEFAKHFVEGKPALRKVLEHGFTRLVHREVLSPAELVDVFTLMDEVTYDEEEFGGQEHLLALQALKLSGLAAREPELCTLLKKIIWRRCMIKDDWEEINKTELKADTQVEVETGATALFRTFKEGYEIGNKLPRSPIHFLVRIADPPTTQASGKVPMPTTLSQPPTSSAPAARPTSSDHGTATAPRNTASPWRATCGRKTTSSNTTSTKAGWTSGSPASWRPRNRACVTRPRRRQRRPPRRRSSMISLPRASGRGTRRRAGRGRRMLLGRCLWICEAWQVLSWGPDGLLYHMWHGMVGLGIG